MAQGETTRGCRLEIRQGRPVLVHNGKPVPPAMYSDPMVHIDPVKHTRPEEWLERYREFRDSGVHVYSLQPVHWVNHTYGTTRYWLDDGVYPEIPEDDEWFCVDKQAAALLEMDPEATFFVRFGDQVPGPWFEKHPDHMQQSWTGVRRQFQGKQPSLASEKALGDLGIFLERFLGYCEGQPWAERVWGYMYYPGGEGISNLNVSGVMFDVSPVMQEAFREWVRGKYADEGKLREAWGDPEASFETVRVPTDPEWRAEISAEEFARDGDQVASFEGGREKVAHWVEGNQLRRCRDYWELQRHLFIKWHRTLVRTAEAALAKRPVVFGIDMCKQPLLGWQHNLSFGGYGPAAEFLDMFVGTGSIDVGELLDEPGLHMLCTPADYTVRTPGYGWEPEGIADSLHLRGKAILVENDARTFNPGQENHTLGAFRDPAEVKAGLLRNASWSLSRGHFDYWMIAGGQYFHHPLVHEHGISVVTPILTASVNWPHVETEHAVAMVIDDSAPQWEDGTSGFSNLAILWQRVLGLAKCGIPYRIYLFSDLEREGMPDYRCYLFPNLFKLDEERMGLLQSKVLRDGRMAIFGPATGITDGERLSAEWTSRLLGVEMELSRQHAPRRVIVQGDSRLARALPAGYVFGDQQPYGPIVIPAEGALEAAGAVHLGMATTFWSLNRPGLFLKDHGDYKVAWSVATPLPGCVLRELAREGGCHVWCEEDDVVLASESFAALHSVKAGPRTLKLPRPQTVWDLLSGEKVGEGLSEIQMEIAPPETRPFLLGDEAPY